MWNEERAWQESLLRGDDVDDSDVIVGVDFVVPKEIVKKYVVMVSGNPNEPIPDKQRIKVYEKMLEALAGWVGLDRV